MRIANLVWVLVSCVAFAGWGCANQADLTTKLIPGGPDMIIVYNMHQTIRCATCVSMEAMTKKLVNSEFNREVKDGLVEWREADYQKNEDLAKRYNVASTSVVVVRFHNNQEMDHQNLTRAMGYAHDDDLFNKYIGDAIRKELAREIN